MPINYKEIVVDTNVFLHAELNTCTYFSCSECLINNIMQNEDVRLFVDESLVWSDENKSSRIINEYIKLIHPGTIGHNCILTLISQSRIDAIPKSNFSSHKKWISKLIRNKNDIFFLAVACCTADQLLATNDYEDFQQDKRDFIRSNYDVNVHSTTEITR